MDLNRRSEIDLLITSLNDKLKPIIRKFRKQILYKYYDNSLVNKLLELFESTESVTSGDFDQFLKSQNAYDTEFGNKLKLIYESGQNLSQSGLDIAKEQIRKFISQLILDKASTQYGSDPASAVDLIKNIDINVDSSIDASHIKRYSLQSIDIKHVLDEFKNPIESSMPTINKCFVTGGYAQHQLINIVAPPSCGKSLFLMNEAVHFIKNGYSVCYVALGDLTESDFASRMAAIGLDETIDNVVMNLEENWNKFKNLIGVNINNFEFLYIDPDTVSMSQLYEYFEVTGIKQKYDIIILDYDTNFRSENDMYEKGGEIYSIASSLSREVKLVFIASQPKIAYYDHEIIPQEGAAESARKSQIVDLMITIGRHPEAVSPVGYINIAKCRRGGRRYKFPYILNPTGRFAELPVGIYNGIIKTQDMVRVKYKGGEEPPPTDQALTNQLDELLKGESK